MKNKNQSKWAEFDEQIKKSLEFNKDIPNKTLAKIININALGNWNDTEIDSLRK